jgi:hypothetical protein
MHEMPFFRRIYIFSAAWIFLFACAGVQPGMRKVIYLSDEWAHSVLLEMKKDREFVRAVQGLNFTLQHEITDIPGRQEQVVYYTQYGFDGPQAVRIGSVAEPEVVFSGTYEVWKKFHSGEITLEEALRDKTITYTGDYRIVAIFLERIKRYGKPLSSIYQRVPTLWLNAP